MKQIANLALVFLLIFSFAACDTARKALKDPYKDLKNELPMAKVYLRGDTIRVVYPEIAMFDFGKADLKSDAKASFVRFAQVLKTYSSLKMNIIGYTDNVGPDNVNYDLSRRRAQTAFNFLRDNGIATSRMATEGRGPENPLMSNDTDMGRQTNRRVEFLLY